MDMTAGMQIRERARRADTSLVEAFRGIPTAIVSDNMARMFSAGAGLRPLHGEAPLLGVALTVRTRPGDNLLVHKAIDIAEPGDVVVVDAGGDTTNAILGEIMMAIARKNGAVGFVVDGAIRDVSAFRRASFPCFARSVNHRGPYKDGPGEINAPVSIGGMIVEPGDIVLGDEDGLLAIRPEEAEAVLEKSRRQIESEAEIIRNIEAGTLDRFWVDDLLAERARKF
jgi:regulator of RNase E activity RraA